jgi:hypothetical protein
MSSTITKRTTKNHGPCDTCGHPILRGMSMRSTTREVTAADEWRHSYQGRVKVKVHLGCPHPDNRNYRDVYGPWPLLTTDDDLHDWSARLIAGQHVRYRASSAFSGSSPYLVENVSA